MHTFGWLCWGLRGRTGLWGQWLKGQLDSSLLGLLKKRHGTCVPTCSALPMTARWEASPIGMCGRSGMESTATTSAASSGKPASRQRGSQQGFWPVQEIARLAAGNLPWFGIFLQALAARCPQLTPLHTLPALPCRAGTAAGATPG